jgi:hypothetical protein
MTGQQNILKNLTRFTSISCLKFSIFAPVKIQKNEYT